jgi:hypothetical protein
VCAEADLGSTASFIRICKPLQRPDWRARFYFKLPSVESSSHFHPKGGSEYLRAEPLSGDLFQLRVFAEQDTPMNQLNRDGSDEDWNAQHIKNEAMLAEADDLINKLTKDLGFSRADVH